MEDRLNQIAERRRRLCRFKNKNSDKTEIFNAVDAL